MKSSLTRRLASTLLFFFILQMIPLFHPSAFMIPFTNIKIHPGSFSFVAPRELNASLTSAYATMGNSRLSFYGKASGAHAAGTSVIVLDTSDNADNNNFHLFPGDGVSVGANGAKTVASVVDDVSDDTFNLTSGLTVGVADQATVYGTQSGALTLKFTLTSTTIPSNGYVKVTLPDPASGGNDGAPDTAATLAANGFDLNSMTTSDVATTGGTGCTWSGAEALNAGSGAGHTYTQVTTTQCTGGEITVTFDGASKDLVNPAPITGHTQGTADYYQINIATYTSGDDLVDSADVIIAPVESVFVSATIDEALTFDVDGVTADSGTVCGVTRTGSTPDSTVYSIPWGTLATTYATATHNAAQLLTVTTNAVSGYKVYIEQNDQMGRNGNTCTGAAPSAGNYTFDAGTCIRDTLCGATPCTHAAAYDWGADPSSYPGFGYALQDSTGTDAKFDYDSNASPCTKSGSGGNFCTKQLADVEGSEDPFATDAEIMTNSGTTDTSSVYVCYRVDVPGNQPAGYYYNKVQYTAVATF